MKYLVVLLFCLCSVISKGGVNDTLFVDNYQDPRFLRYKDSMQGYNISYSIAKNMADTLKGILGDNGLDDYFLSKFTGNGEGSSSGGYFYDFVENANVEIGHVNINYRNMKNDARFPWKYLETQYRRLDSIKVQPWGIMEGAELPNVYVYRKPSLTVIFKKIKRFTVIDYTIQFFQKDNGKTRVSYIRKFYYSEFDKVHQRIDSIEKLDPITLQRLPDQN